MSGERKEGAPVVVRHCSECPFGVFMCAHPDAPALAANIEPMRMARLAEQVLAKIDGSRPRWCPLNRRTLLVRAWREGDTPTSDTDGPGRRGGEG